MKLIFAIVNKDDSNTVSTALTKAGVSVTKLATTGGFLQAGNTTFLVGTEDERVDDVLGIIEKHCKKRTPLRMAVRATSMAAFPAPITMTRSPR